MPDHELCFVDKNKNEFLDFNFPGLLSSVNKTKSITKPPPNYECRVLPEEVMCSVSRELKILGYIASFPSTEAQLNDVISSKLGQIITSEADG